jgi:hypothetical protein
VCCSSCTHVQARRWTPCSGKPGSYGWRLQALLLPMSVLHNCPQHFDTCGCCSSTSVRFIYSHLLMWTSVQRTPLSWITLYSAAAS